MHRTARPYLKTAQFAPSAEAPPHNAGKAASIPGMPSGLRCTPRWPVECFRFLFSYTRFMSRYERPSHRVYMSFFFKSGWQVQFLEADLKTALPRKLTFSDPEKIRELAKRGEAWATSEARQMLELAIEQGRGGLYLKLTAEQYSKLRQTGAAH
jgi:hypothetical protein